MVRWKIYYDDKSAFTDLDGLPEDAPMDGVQIIMEYWPNGTRTIHQGSDYYWWCGDNWASGGPKDIERHMRKRPPIALVVLFGRWWSRREYFAMVEHAMSNCDGC